ncbi:pancreatic lipase-related protein 2-like isoform X1 [Ranitomeya variabilis]|uniref:pancreatic lipase-related protein 2-like isoform X1 n=1 Tax=Ranitomeya variabilis TaxID=490064 RepID=UPI004056E21D
MIFQQCWVTQDYGPSMSAAQRMRRITVLIVLMMTDSLVTGEEVCYDHLGCFSDSNPWSGTLQRPHPALPWSPEKINTKFFLFTREQLSKYQIISDNNFTSSNFRTSRTTCVIVHGMADKAENNWVSDMCQAILTAEDVNCIGVDWRHGSGSVALYVQAANNARLVGAEIAHFLRRWQELKYPPSNVHIIGHSLGAHAAGEAGRRLPGIRRITGLDPARPWFENTPEDVRLDPSDADFVDVIHTDTNKLTGVGIIKPIGHADFYPNGGRHMTGCPSKLAILGNKSAALQILACNHFRAFLYFTYSVRHRSGFVSYPCGSYEDFTAGSCFPCPPGGCPSMGYYADAWPYNTSRRQSFYLNTGGDRHHFSRGSWALERRIPPSWTPRWRRALCTMSPSAGLRSFVFSGSGSEQRGSTSSPERTEQYFPSAQMKLSWMARNKVWTPVTLSRPPYSQPGEDGRSAAITAAPYSSGSGSQQTPRIPIIYYNPLLLKILLLKEKHK